MSNLHKYWYFYNLPIYKKNKMIWPPGLRRKVNTLGVGPENHHWFCAIRLRVGRTPRPRVKEAVEVISDCLTGILGIDRLDWTPQNRCNGSNLPCSHVASILYYSHNLLSKDILDRLNFETLTCKLFTKHCKGSSTFRLWSTSIQFIGEIPCLIVNQLHHNSITHFFMEVFGVIGMKTNSSWKAVAITIDFNRDDRHVVRHKW